MAQSGNRLCSEERIGDPAADRKLSPGVDMEARQERFRRSDHRLKELSKDIAVTEAAVAIDRERRVMRHLVVESEATVSTIGEGKFDLLAQLALEADAL
jgi:hypothetical protein